MQTSLDEIHGTVMLNLNKCFCVLFFYPSDFFIILNYFDLMHLNTPETF